MAVDLYAIPLEEFITRRDELARQLAAAGEADGAKRVKTMRKPTVTAWTLNQLVRKQPGLIAALASAHEKLRSAGSAAELRAASEERRSAINQIVYAAEDVSETVRKKMRSTLLAAGTVPSAEAALVEGRLEKEFEPGGLGGFDIGLDLAPAPAPGEKAEVARATKAQEKADRLLREAEEAAEEARSLREAADRAERLAAAAEERAEQKRRDAEKAVRSAKGR